MTDIINEKCRHLKEDQKRLKTFHIRYAWVATQAFHKKQSSQTRITYQTENIMQQDSMQSA